jgi:hypothetical protein
MLAHETNETNPKMGTETSERGKREMNERPYPVSAEDGECYPDMTPADTVESQREPEKRPVELCYMCGNDMKLPDEDKIEYDYDAPPKVTGVCSYCADIRHHSL